MKAENFFLPGDFISGIDMQEISATFEAMIECDLDRAPYPELYITVPEEAVIRSTDKPLPLNGKWGKGLMEFHFLGIDGPLRGTDGGTISGGLMKAISWHGKSSLDYFEAIPKALADRPAMRDDLTRALAEYGAQLLVVLVVSLATKQVVKVREKNKLASLGIGKGRESRHSYTTTISVPRLADLDEEPSHGTGKPRAPHLRRGHVRRQKYGPGNQWEKKIFIEAVFVNSDREFVSMRDHYNISFKGVR